MKSIAILTGGGPAPGMNTVVASVAKTFLRDGFRVIGLHGGYSALFTDKPRMQDVDFLLADEIFNKGGSVLKMSRFKPTDEDFQSRFNLDFFTSNEVKLLVTVGGDDTASTANRSAFIFNPITIAITTAYICLFLSFNTKVVSLQ